MDEFGEEGFQIPLRCAAGDFEACCEVVEDLLAWHALAQGLHDDERRRAGGEKFTAGGVKTKTVGLPGDGVELEGGRFGALDHSGGRDAGRLLVMLLAAVTNRGGKRREFHGGG